MAKWELQQIPFDWGYDHNNSGSGKVGKAPKPKEPTIDIVNKPPHYNNGSIESIDYIQSFLSPEEYRGFLRGNISKYLHRWTYKGKPIEDLKKAQWYLNRLIESEEAK